MNVETLQSTPQLMSIRVAIDSSDYQADFKKQLKEYREQANLKGFRRGKAPQSIIRKMYGKQIIQDVVLQKLNESLYKHLEDEKIDYLGNPIVVEDQAPLEISMEQSEYSLDFQLAIKPPVDTDALAKAVTLTKHEATISDEDITEALAQAQKQLGEKEDVTDAIQDEDLLHIQAVELDGDKIKEGGWSTKFLLLTSQIQDESIKKKALGSKVGDTLDMDIYKVENSDPKWVRKHLLNIPEDSDQETGAMYRGTIEQVERLMPASLDQDFYDKYFGKDVVSNEKEARDKIRVQMQQYTEDVAKSLMTYQLRTGLLEASGMELPEDHMRLWLAQQSETAEPVTDEQWKSFEQGMKWTIIRNAYAEKYEVSVDEGDVFDSVKQGIRQYFSQYMQYVEDDRLTEMADNMMENRETYNREYDKVLNEKLIAILIEKLPQETKAVTKEELDSAYAQMREEIGS